MITFIKNYGKYIFALLFLAVAGYILFYLTYDNVKQEMIESLNARQLIHAKQAAGGIEIFFHDHTESLLIMAKNEHIIDLDETGKMLMRETQIVHRKEVNIISRIDSKGRIIHAEPYDESVIGQPVISMESFQKVKHTHEINLSDIFTNRRGFQSIILHVPVFKGYSFDGTLAMLFSFEAIAGRYLKDIRIGNDGYAWVISSNGIEIYCPVPGHVGNSVFDNCRDFPDIIDMAHKMVKGEQGVTTYIFDRIRGNSVKKIRKHAVFMPVSLGDNFWSIVVATPENEVTKTLSGFRDKLLLIALLLMAVSGFFLYLLIRSRIIIRETEQRRKIENELIESKQRYDRLVSNIPAGVYLLRTTPAGEFFFEYVSPRMEEILSIPATSILGDSEEAFLPIHPEDIEAFRKLNQERIEDCQPFFWEGRAVIEDSVKWIRIQSHPEQLTSGDILWHGIVEDITEPRHAKEELHIKECAIASSFNGVAISDLKGNLTYVNNAFLGMWSCTAWEARAINAVDLVSKKEEFLSILNQIKEKGFCEGESVAVKKDGALFDIQFNASLVRSQADNPIAMLFTFTDITALKRSEEERHILEERLQRSEKMEALGTLAGGVAHDLNNVLGVVIGYSELLLSGLDESNAIKTGLEKIMYGGQKAAAIVQDLLTLSRRVVASKQVLNLNKIITDCERSPDFANFCSYHPAVRFHNDLEPELLNMSGSPVHLGKTVFNLISNACEAMPDGGTVTVKTANRNLDKPIQGYDEVREGDYVMFSITDTGIGISASDLKHIFEPFYTKKVMGKSGTGLGLAVVWGTVKDHNGYITVESEEGKGSTFTLYFPVTREELTDDSLLNVPVSEYMGKGESILVVDDIQEQRDLAAEILRKLNYNVTCVSSGEEAVAYLKEHNVDLIVLDMIMNPGMDGLDTYSRVIKIHPKQKAVIVSGFSATERVNEAQAMGAGAYVRKPYLIDKLGLAVRKELD